MNKVKPDHNCLEHLDDCCRCAICGSSKHVCVSDSAGSGMGRVNVACLRCGKTEAFYDDTGSTIYSDFDDVDYDYHGYSRVSKEDLINKMMPGHDCNAYVDKLQGICLLCGDRFRS